MASVTESGIEPSSELIELSFPMPRAPDTRIHLQLTVRSTSLLLFVSSVIDGNTSATASMGSFVYAIPDVDIIPSLLELDGQ